MRLEVENFGPVSKASIETGKLTIFIGKNSTGKSYTAILMKALYTIMLKTLRHSFFLRFKEKDFENKIKEEIKVGLPAFFSTTNLDSLIKWGSKSLSIKFSDKWFNLEIEKEKDGEYKVEFAISKEFYKDFENENIFHSFRKIPYMYYLPASRTGIFESYNVLAAAIINLAPSRIVFGMDIELPGVSPILSEFLSQILLFSGGIKKMKEKKSKRVERIIGGEIVISSKKDRPQILFSQKNHKIPIERVSSGISELAPLILYLKYVIKDNDFLIIEEPEAHLHPSAIFELTKSLGFISKKVNLILTTHSDILLSAVSTLIKANKDKEAAKKFGILEDEILSINDVKVYLFDEEVKEIKVTEDGVPLDEFNKIRDEISDIYYMIDES